VGYLSAEKRRSGAGRVAVSGGFPPVSEVDQEIRELGERYGIPTEFSSYLVVEPGMDPRRRLGALQNAPSAVRASTMVGGTSKASEKTFEAARAAAVQRSATSLSVADELSGISSNNVSLRRSGNRVFALRDSVWTDVAFKDSMRRLKLRAYSAAYFRILEMVPELREPFALGEKVIVAGRSVAIEIAPDGAESLTDAELRALQSSW
jgi:hypothetical protein